MEIDLGFSKTDFEEIAPKIVDGNVVPVRSIGDLTAVDRAVTKLVIRSLLTAKSASDEGFQRFVARPLSVYSHAVFSQHDEPKEMLRRYRQSIAGLDLASDRLSPSDSPLPLVFVSRRPGMTALLSDQGGKGRHDQPILESDHLDADKSFLLTDVPVSLSYQLSFVAHETTTLDVMQLAWASYVSNTKSRNHHFVASTDVDGVGVLAACRLMDPKAIQFDDISLPIAEDRLVAIATNVEVATEAIAGRQVSRESLKLQLNRAVPME